MSKSPPQIESPAAPLTAIQRCGSRAQHLISLCFADASKLDTDGLVKLRSLISDLSADREGDALQQLLDLLSDSNLVSTFELSTSGVIETVTEHLAAMDIPDAGPASTAAKLHRLQRVMKVCCS